ncbi:MAG: SURF1 family protein [Microthrixaceae bacterium]
MTADYRFARRPWWIVLHVLVLVAVLVMVRLGFWQLDRLHEKQDLADTLAAREREPSVAIDTLVEPADSTEAADELSYRNVTATGEYLADEEVLIANRTQGGLPGYWVVTPLRLSGDEAVAVLRGFVPLAVGDEGVPVPAAAPPAGPVSVTGWVQSTAERGLLGGSDDRPGTLERYNRLDLERLAEQVSVPLDPVALVATGQEPATDGDALQEVPRPEPDLGPHAGYAGQWFLFALVFAVGYPLFLRRQARSGRREGATDG